MSSWSSKLRITLHDTSSLQKAERESIQQSPLPSPYAPGAGGNVGGTDAPTNASGSASIRRRKNL